MKNLFVPLTKEAYEWFAQGKRYELRIAQRQWNERQIQRGRGVTLSCGYSGPRRYGVIGNRIIFGSLKEILHRVSYRAIIPTATSAADAEKKIRAIMSNAEIYVAFEVVLEG